jgi:hypothetical protein
MSNKIINILREEFLKEKINCDDCQCRWDGECKGKSGFMWEPEDVFLARVASRLEKELTE